MRVHPFEQAARHDLNWRDLQPDAAAPSASKRSAKGFTSRHAVYRLVYFEMLQTMEAAIEREKQLKNWRRAWKVQLIESENPEWADLAIGFGFEPVRREQAVR